MSETFQCPTCGAPQEVPAEPGKTTIRCSYCGQSVVIPESLRIPEEPAQSEQDYSQQVFVNVSGLVREAEGPTATPDPTVSNRTVRRFITCAVVMVVVVGLLSIVIPLLVVPTVIKGGAKTIEQFLSEPTVIAVFEEPMRVLEEQAAAINAAGNDIQALSGFATLELSLGQEGMGPGQFKDLRHVGVDSQGRIYAGEYQGGRVQVFDQAGIFSTQWRVDDEFPLVSLSAERDGTIYIVQRGEIQLIEGPTGASLGKLDYPNGFDDAFPTLDGGLLTSYQGQADDILRFDNAGKVVLSIPSAISEQTGRSELSMKVAEDGQGNIYALGTFNNAVFVFSPQGKFLNRIGSEGDQPGQFRALHDLALDGQGRLYVSDWQGVQVFSTDGRFLGLIEVDGPAFGLAVDDQDNLYVAARTQLFKYKIP